jgi:Fe-S-cluster containining protein
LNAVDRIPEACLDEIERVYAELEADLAREGYVCRACGDCCRLAAHGFRLYLSTLELALILQRCVLDRLPPERDGRCGFQQDGRCTIHAVRPIGCRTFFCEAEGGHLSDLYERTLKRLKRLAETYGCRWEYCQKYPAD